MGTMMAVAKGSPVSRTHVYLLTIEVKSGSRELESSGEKKTKGGKGQLPSPLVHIH